MLKTTLTTLVFALCLLLGGQALAQKSKWTAEQLLERLERCRTYMERVASEVPVDTVERICSCHLEKLQKAFRNSKPFESEDGASEETIAKTQVAQHTCIDESYPDSWAPGVASFLHFLSYRQSFFTFNAGDTTSSVEDQCFNELIRLDYPTTSSIFSAIAAEDAASDYLLKKTMIYRAQTDFILERAGKNPRKKYFDSEWDPQSKIRFDKFLNDLARSISGNIPTNDREMLCDCMTKLVQAKYPSHAEGETISTTDFHNEALAEKYLKASLQKCAGIVLSKR